MPIAIPGKCNVSRLKPGDKWSRISFGEIIKARGDDIIVKNEHGVEWSITPEIVEAEFYTSDQYDEVKEVNRTEMVEVILVSARLVMTVHFKKKPDPKDLLSLVTELLDDEGGGRTRPSKIALNKKLKVATGGKDRTMIGRHTGNQDEFGRLQFTDMEASGSPLKQVDPRTVEWAIIGNVKYVLK